MLEMLLSLPLLIVVILIIWGRRKRKETENIRFLTQYEAENMISEFLEAARFGDLVVATSRVNGRFVQFITENGGSENVPVWDIPIEFSDKTKINELKRFLENNNMPFIESHFSGAKVIHSTLGTCKVDIDKNIHNAISFAGLREPIDLWFGNTSKSNSNQ